jgi:hypothetical protein
VFSIHNPKSEILGCDTVRGAVGRGAPREWCQGAPRHRQHGACLLMPGPWLASLAGQEPRTGLGHAVDRKPKAQGTGEAPEPQAEAAVESGSAGSLCQRVHASVPDRHGPKPSGDPEGVDRGGLFRSGTIGPEA